MRVPFVMAVCWAGLAPSAAFAQWQMQTSNTTADLRGIDNVGGGVAWASGTHGTVLRTEDGGYVWQPCTVPPGAENLDFRGVQAFDANTAIVMSSGPGDQSRLYKTTDGCHTWKLLFTNPDGPDGFFDSFYMHPLGAGILLGDPVKNKFAVFETKDGGNHWKRDIDSGLGIDRKRIAAFAASNSVLVTSPSGYEYGFVTGGADGSFFFSRNSHLGHWTRTPLNLAAGTESSGAFSIADRFTLLCADCSHDSDDFRVVVGGDYMKPDSPVQTASWSGDFGQTWNPAQAPPHGYRSSVAYDAELKLWITVGPNGTDVSADDGKNWRAVHPDAALHEAADADRNWNALSLPFVVGPHGRIGRLEAGAVKPSHP